MTKHTARCECGKSFELDHLPERSHLCDCGKECFIDFKTDMKFIPFTPYYDKVLRTWVTSASDQEKKMKNHKSYSHPDGLYAVQDDKKFLKECKVIRENRLEYMKQHYGESYVNEKLKTNRIFRDKVLSSRKRFF